MNKRNTEKGVTLLEALISTAIVGIGFVAVFQLVNFSVGSINVSGERTKINYITSMIAEDVIGSRDALYGVNPRENTIAINEYGKPVNANGTPLASGSSIMKFSQYLMEGWESNTENARCSANKGKFFTKDEIKNIYENNENVKGAPENKIDRWEAILNEDRYLKCKNNKDLKSVKIYKICKSGSNCIQGGQEGIPATKIEDEIYIGRIQINTNGGKKRKFLYFQADYIFKQ